MLSLQQHQVSQCLKPCCNGTSCTPGLANKSEGDRQLLLHCHCMHPKPNNPMLCHVHGLCDPLQNSLVSEVSRPSLPASTCSSIEQDALEFTVNIHLVMFFWSTEFVQFFNTFSQNWKS